MIVCAGAPNSEGTVTEWKITMREETLPGA